MILINLLPHREERRRLRQQAFYVGLGVAAAVGVALAALWYAVLQQSIERQQQRNDYLSAEIRKLDLQIKDVASLNAEIEALKARQAAVENLQTERNMPVRLLDELARQTPEGVYLSAIRQDGAKVTLNGIAQTNERVSEFLRNTAHQSPWIERPELVEIRIAAPGAGGQSRRVFDFAVRVQLKAPPEAASAVTGIPAAKPPRRS